MTTDSRCLSKPRTNGSVPRSPRPTFVHPGRAGDCQHQTARTTSLMHHVAEANVCERCAELVIGVLWWRALQVTEYWRRSTNERAHPFRQVAIARRRSRRATLKSGSGGTWTSMRSIRRHFVVSEISTVSAPYQHGTAGVESRLSCTERAVLLTLASSVDSLRTSYPTAVRVLIRPVTR